MDTFEYDRDRNAVINVSGASRSVLPQYGPGVSSVCPWQEETGRMIDVSTAKRVRILCTKVFNMQLPISSERLSLVESITPS